MNSTPTSVLVLGIIGIIFSAFGLVGLILALIQNLVHFGPPSPMVTALHADTGYVIMTAAGLLIGFPTLIIQLCASISSLRLRRWARMAMIVCAWISMIHGAIGTAFNFVHVFPLMERAVPPNAPPTVAAILQFTMVGSGCGFFLGLIYPICVIVFFSRTKIINAFNGTSLDPHSHFQALPPVAPPATSSDATDTSIFP